MTSLCIGDILKLPPDVPKHFETKSNFEKMYKDFKKSKMIHDLSNNLRVCD
jgi:hypothetical protein